MEDTRDHLLHSAAARQWERVGIRHHHGISIPLFSIHSQKSCGIGEFLDLIPLIFWCREVGFDVIQLLPLNDTGMDTSPYNGISACALNPIYLSISSLPDISRVPNYEEKLAKMRHWNRSPRVKHHIVRELKLSFLFDYFSLVFSEIENKESYQQFCQHHSWVRAYAVFRALKEFELWKSWEDWPLSVKSPSDESFSNLALAHQKKVQFYTFLQYLCYQQMREVRKAAEEAAVFLKGDIPILMSRDSVDVWYYRRYFLMHLVAGAPPDCYAEKGQYWGFPPYDWEEIEKSGYEWWKQRLQAASELYHLYRIDHVVGFFRLWVIPLGKEATTGCFIPAQESEWIPHGKKMMEIMLTSSPLLPIGEDLGTVPPSIKAVLAQLGICGTRVMRWERRWDGDGGFIPVSAYLPTSMTTVSTHDSDTLQLWWSHSPKEARLYCEFKKWDYKPFLSLDRHHEILMESHRSASLFHINLLQEYLALFPSLVSPNPNDERINFPGKILDTNWTYRVRPSLEEIQAHIPLKEMMRGFSRNSN